MSKIVDLDGLSDNLLCSKNTLMKTWKQYPHFFIGLGRTAKGARFDVNDVLQYLKERDYADLGQKDKELHRPGKGIRPSSSYAVGIPNAGSRKKVGTQHQTGTKRVSTTAKAGDPFNLLAGLR